MSNSNLTIIDSFKHLIKAIKAWTTDRFISTSQVGDDNGLAPLKDGKVPSIYLPSYVDDVIEGFYNKEDGKFYQYFSGTEYSTEIKGESGKIYVDINSTGNNTYRYAEETSTYILISNSLVIGTGAENAAAGNHRHNNASDSGDGFMSASDKTKLDAIEAGAQVNVQPDWEEKNEESDAYILNKPQIPTKLPNPAAITFTGAVKGSYDGSEAITLEIPVISGEDGEDGISPTATVQQTGSGAVITVTDVNGTTTATVLNGQSGKSAYQYAKDGGYTGTEEEFTETLGKTSAAGSLNIETLTMNIETDSDTGGNTLTLSDTYNNTKSVVIPAIALSDEQINSGISKWFDENDLEELLNLTPVQINIWGADD